MKITFSPDKKDKSIIATFLIKLFKPLLESFKTVSIINGVDKKHSCCPSIEVVGNRLINILSTLNYKDLTVSHICSCTGLLSTITILDEKSTPTVT